MAGRSIPRRLVASWVVLLLLIAAPPANARAQDPPKPQAPDAQKPQTPPAPPPVAFDVTVVGTTPLPGVELPASHVPIPVQTATDKDIASSGALDISNFLTRRMNGVFVNETQNNPFQPDVNYRGYTASPLLGTPQGLSIYMDGVRLNQPSATSSAGT